MIVIREPKILVRKARNPKLKTVYQRTKALSEHMGKAIKVSLLDGIKAFRSKVSTEALKKAWEHGSYGHLMGAIRWDDLHQDLLPVKEQLIAGVQSTSKVGLLSLPPNAQKQLRYDIKNPRIQRYIETHTSSLIQGITNDAHQVIARAVTKSFTHGLTPDMVAKQIKGSIGLLPSHSIAVERYEDGLLKQGVDFDRAATQVEAYQNRLLDYRANTIARTEVRGAVNFGQLEVWQQGADQGYINRDNAKKVWLTDGNPCEICDPMDGIAVGLDDVWVPSTGEPCFVPTDVHPNCLCQMELDMGSAEDELEQYLEDNFSDD